jgi:hypothetical protein
VSSDDLAARAAVARKVAVRRVKRRLKAAAAIGLALMAGAFLACTPDKDKQKPRVPVPPNPMTPSVGAVPSQAPAGPDAGLHGDAGQAGLATTSASGNASSTAIVQAPKTPPKAVSVDRKEHRKGMPVPDKSAARLPRPCSKAIPPKPRFPLPARKLPRSGFVQEKLREQAAL